MGCRTHCWARYIVLEVSSPQGLLALAVGPPRIARTAILPSSQQIYRNDLVYDRALCSPTRQTTAEYRTCIEDRGGTERTFCLRWARNSAPFQLSSFVAIVDSCTRNRPSKDRSDCDPGPTHHK
ncbi:unnamed protein product [Mycena citricolor]|uniref:Uncharacterized protein n=1 Tax=Mycena citricolor TaxID=2018698 RepID=A0AAD2HFS6_9AGAR|nr:unnamed protein product [Mycena citricolor]